VNPTAVHHENENHPPQSKIKDKYNYPYNPLAKIKQQANDDEDIKSIASRLSKFTNRSKRSNQSKNNRSVVDAKRNKYQDNISEHKTNASIAELKHIKNISINGDETLNPELKKDEDDEGLS